MKKTTDKPTKEKEKEETEKDGKKITFQAGSTGKPLKLTKEEIRKRSTV